MASAAGDGGGSSSSPVEGNVAPVASPALTEQMAVMKAAASLAEQSTRAITAAVAAYTAAQARSQHRAAKPSAAPSPPPAPSASSSTQHPPHPRALLKQRALPLLGSVIKVRGRNRSLLVAFLALHNPHSPFTPTAGLQATQRLCCGSPAARLGRCRAHEMPSRVPYGQPPRQATPTLLCT